MKNYYELLEVNPKASKEIIEKVFDEIKYIQTLDLSGGEVFLERLSR